MRIVIAAPLLLLACGGSTASDAGHTTGTTSSGGVAGSAGSGGSTTGGSGPGGSGIGGDTTSGSGGGGAAGNETGKKISSVCLAVADTACSVSECLAKLTRAQYHANLYGCGAELTDFLECTLKQPYMCTALPEGYMTNPSPGCAKKEATLKACLPSCSLYGACQVECKAKVSWQVDCIPNGEFLFCECTTGPYAGTNAVLVTTCGGSDFVDLTERLCVGGPLSPDS